MSLPKKISRPINIEGVKCRWLISKSPEALKIIIQGDGGSLKIHAHEETEGMVWLTDTSSQSHAGPVTPNWIRTMVQMAMKKGWHPSGDPSFEFDLKGEGLVCRKKRPQRDEKE